MSRLVHVKAHERHSPKKRGSHSHSHSPVTTPPFLLRTAEMPGKKVRELGAASAALAAPRSAFGFMKSSWPLWLVWSLVTSLVTSLVGGKTGIASNTVKPTGVREPVRYLPPLTEMARRRFRGLAFG